MSHLVFSLSVFSCRLLEHIKSLGAVYSDEERESFIQVWRYTGYLMGMPDAMLYPDHKKGMELYKIGSIIEPVPQDESVMMANAVINSGPLIIGIDEPRARRKYVGNLYNLSRALLGDSLADDLNFPPKSPIFTLVWLRMLERFFRLASKVYPGFEKKFSFDRFTYLLNLAMFEEAGISYRMPDRVHAEDSSSW